MGKIGVINGLRGLAILGVVYHHLVGPHTPPGWSAVTVAGFEFHPFSIVSNGWMGVNLFFILSGFVLYLPYASGERTLSAGADAWSYYKRRAGRLLPLYYISILTVIFFVWDMNGDQAFLRNLFLMATATFNFTLDMWAPKYNSDLWSIGIEIWFSVLFPLFVVIGRKTGAVRLFAAVSLISLLVRFAGVSYEGFEIGSAYQNALKDSLAGRMDDFILGMLLCHLYVTRLKERPLRHPALSMAAGIFLLAIGANIWDYKVLGALPTVYAIPFATNILHAGFFLIVASALSMRGAGVALLANRPLQVAGMMSYSLYIWHHLALRLMTRSDYGLFRGRPFDYEYTTAFIVVYLAFIAVFSALTYRYIEFGRKDWRELFLWKGDAAGKGKAVKTGL